MGRTHQRKTQQQPNTKDIHRHNINHSLRSVSSGDQGDSTNESHQVFYHRSLHHKSRGSEEINLRAEANRKNLKNSMKINKQSPHERKGGSLRKMLSEKEANQLSDVEFKELFIRKLNELTENYQKLQGKYNELTANYINMKKEIETINKGQEEMKNRISELKNTVEGIKSRLDEAEDKISELEDKVEKNTQNEQDKEKRLRKNEEGLREMQDNMKRNNICIIWIPEGEE